MNYGSAIFVLTVFGACFACGAHLDVPNSNPNPSATGGAGGVTVSTTGGANGVTVFATGGAGTPGSTPDSNGGAATGAVTLSALSKCASVRQGERLTPTLADFQTAVFGDWGLCKSPSTFGTTDEVGLEITPDQRWHKLMAAGGLSVTLGIGWGNEGSWEIIDTSIMNGPGVFQLNLNIDGSGTVITIPVFAQSPDIMRLDNNGVFVADYVRLN